MICAKVFLLSLPEACWESDQKPRCWDILEASTMTRDYCCFQNLRLTCRCFNEVFLRYPELSACVYLDYHLGQDALPSLVPTAVLRRCSPLYLTAILKDPSLPLRCCPAKGPRYSQLSLLEQPTLL